MFLKSHQTLFIVTFTFFLLAIKGGCDAHSCACVENYGTCDCPKSGACPCMQNQGFCRCNHENLEPPAMYHENETFSVDELSCPCSPTPLPQHQFYLGPEIYGITRDKAGKNNRSKQHGVMYGGRFNYDRIKRCRIYWGFDALYASGEVQGRKNRDNKIKLHLRDGNVEGRLGYTFQLKRSCWLPTLVPFIGYGYLEETSSFKKPSPIQIKQKISFDYVALGFLSQFYPAPAWVVGINFKSRFLIHSKCRISDDPDYENTSQNFQHKVQYRVEVPIIYRLHSLCDRLAVAFVPFYEYRHYGEQANFPFDFLDAKLNLYGADLFLMYMF